MRGCLPSCCFVAWQGIAETATVPLLPSSHDGAPRVGEMNIQQTVAWTWQASPGLEVACLREDTRGISVTGRVVTAMDDRVLQLDYRIGCDPGWIFRHLSARCAFDGRVRELNLRHDGEGWLANGVVRSDLVTAVDIDIMGTPLTNTLPIRRVPWTPGACRPFMMAYVQLPDLIVVPARQRYTALGSPGRFLYESLPGARAPSDNPRLPGHHGMNEAFTAELEVDAHGLVVAYPPYWRRMAGC